MTKNRHNSDTRAQLDDPPRIIEPSEQYYDYIIVGGGTAAMGFLYGLLEETNPVSVGRIAILEQGACASSSDDNKLRDWYIAAQNRSNIVGEASLGSRRVKISQGKGRGGTTRINAGLCCSWTKEETENGSLSRAMQHLQAVLRKNGVFEDQPVPMIVKPSNGTRVDYYQGLIEPLGQLEGVEWIEGATCRRILYKNNQITGVEYTTTTTDNSTAPQQLQLYASRVILSAGVFASPVILAASELLGNNLFSNSDCLVQDHVMIPAAFLVWPTQTNSSTDETPYWNGVKGMNRVDINEDYTFQISEMDVSVFSSILPSLAVDYLFHRTAWDGWEWFIHPIDTVIETILRFVIAWTPLYWFLKYCVKVVAVFLVRSPTAYNGSFRILRQEDESYKVSNITLDYLRSDRDVAAVQHFWAEYMTIQTCAIQGWEFFPGPLVRSNFRLGGPLHEERFRLFCQEFCLPFYHWSGSLSSAYGSPTSDPPPVPLLPHGLFLCDASTLHPLPPVPPALTLAAHGYLLAKNLHSQAESLID